MVTNSKRRIDQKRNTLKYNLLYNIYRDSHLIHSSYKLVLLKPLFFYFQILLL